VLGGHVGGLEQARDLGMHRAHVDDRAALLLRVHRLEAGAGGQEGAVEVDREHLLPGLERHLVHRADHLHAGIADQDVDAAELAHDALHTGLHLRLAGDVHGDADGLAAGIADLPGHRLGPFQVEVGDGDLGALAGEGQRDAAADAAGRTRDDGYLICHAHESVLRIREGACRGARWRRHLGIGRISRRRACRRPRTASARSCRSRRDPPGRRSGRRPLPASPSVAGARVAGPWRAARRSGRCPRPRGS